MDRLGTSLHLGGEEEIVRVCALAGGWGGSTEDPVAHLSYNGFGVLALGVVDVRCRRVPRDRPALDPSNTLKTVPIPLIELDLVHSTHLLRLVLKRHLRANGHSLPGGLLIVDLDIHIVIVRFFRTQIFEGPRVRVDVLDRHESSLQVLLLDLGLVELVLQPLVGCLLSLLPVLVQAYLVRGRLKVAVRPSSLGLFHYLLFICFVFELLELGPVEADVEQLWPQACLYQFHVGEDVFHCDWLTVLAAEYVCILMDQCLTPCRGGRSPGLCLFHPLLLASPRRDLRQCKLLT